MNPTPIALIYDFDGTLATGNMQEHGFIPSLGINQDAFWREVEDTAKEGDIDPILVYMHLMIRESAKRNIPITRQTLRGHGENLPLFPGVTEWFDALNAYRPDADVRHYIISSGLREMIHGLPIARNFTRIFACDFIYKNDIAVSPGLGINYTNKTQFLFRINKDTNDVSDTSIVNAVVVPEDRPLPFSHMIYIGDGPTDIPCFTVIRKNGGYGIAVHEAEQQRAKETCEQMLDDGRIHHIAEADYRTDRRLMRVVKGMIDIICAQQRIYDERG